MYACMPKKRESHQALSVFKQLGEVFADATNLYVHDHIRKHPVGTWKVLHADD